MKNSLAATEFLAGDIVIYNGVRTIVARHAINDLYVLKTAKGEVTVSRMFFN